MLENEIIIKMHNSGATVRQISDETKFSKSKVHRIVTNYLSELDPNENSLKVVPTVEPGKLFNSFVGFVRLSLNCWSNKDTGEIVNIKFVPSNDINKCGNFVTC